MKIYKKIYEEMETFFPRYDISQKDIKSFVGFLKLYPADTYFRDYLIHPEYKKVLFGIEFIYFEKIALSIALRHIKKPVPQLKPFIRLCTACDTYYKGWLMSLNRRGKSRLCSNN